MKISSYGFIIYRNTSVFFVFLLLIGTYSLHLYTSNHTIPSKIFEGYYSDDKKIIQGQDLGIIESLINKDNTGKKLDLGKIYKGDTEVENFWGKNNIKILDDNHIRVRYPAGSFSPGQSTIRGGAGFFYTPSLSKNVDKFGLEYTIKFDPNFDFVKGGKLPGLCGGICPRGGENSPNGFSTRIMWRKDGMIELYAYFPKSMNINGERLGINMFQFKEGRQYIIRQEIKLNTFGNSDGIIILYIDNKPVYTNSRVEFFSNNDRKVKIFFSTFFGGSDSTWATLKETYIEFKNMKYYYE